MTNDQMERRLSAALDKTAPDDVDGVLSRCTERKGTVVPMKKKNNRMKKWMQTVAACLAVLLLGGGGFAFMQYQKKQREVAMKAAQRRAQQAFARAAHRPLHHDAPCPAHASTSRIIFNSCSFSFWVRTAVRYQQAERPG